MWASFSDNPALALMRHDADADRWKTAWELLTPDAIVSSHRKRK